MGRGNAVLERGEHAFKKTEKAIQKITARRAAHRVGIVAEKFFAIEFREISVPVGKARGIDTERCDFRREMACAAKPDADMQVAARQAAHPRSGTLDEGHEKAGARSLGKNPEHAGMMRQF